MPAFNSPPNWPKPPEGWTPPPGWKPDPAWGPAPHGWRLWTEDQPMVKKSWFARHKILTGIGAVAAVGIIASAVNGGGTDPTASTAAGGAPSTTKQATTNQQAAKQPSTKAKTESKSANTEAPAANSGDADQAPPLAKLGDTVKDGSLSFKVTKVSCGHSKIGDAYLNTKAQGQFCILSLRVSNVGDKSALFADSNQKLINAKGQEFDTDTGAAIYLDNSNAFLEEINPGNTVSGKIVFDIPKTAKPEVLELHDNRFFSEGVRVDLS